MDTATDMPEAVAFYRASGYRETGRETRPGWSWTLVYFVKQLPGGHWRIAAPGGAPVRVPHS